MKNRSLVVGIGITGVSIMRYLDRKNINFSVYNLTPAPEKIESLQKTYPKTTFYVSSCDLINWEEINQVIVSPGVSPKSQIIEEALSRSLPVIGDLELFAKEQTNKPTIAITGTNGKSTLVTLIAILLEELGIKVALAGNIGKPMLDTLDSDVDLWILELSSFQLHYQESFVATVSCILNITQDHISWHGSFNHYKAAKHKIYHQKSLNIFNADDEETYPISPLTGRSFSLKGSKKSTFYYDDNYFFKGESTLFHHSALLLKGAHNYENVLAALSIIDGYGVNILECIPALKHFEGLEHRTQFIKNINGLHWINDSKGTNVGATLAALDGISHSDALSKVIWLGGGVGKGADFSALKSIISTKVRHVVLYGEDKNIIAKAIENCGIPISIVTDMSEAIKKAEEKGKRGDSILLSPACASFDMFENYIERGEKFIALVNLIK